MYSLINENISEILGLFDREKDINRYIGILEGLRETNVSEDRKFQDDYRQYWAMNAARLSPEFLEYYFGLLEDAKMEESDLDVAIVTKVLFEKPTGSKGQISFQFSFATKLVHSCIPTLPVYDSTVRAFYFLPEASTVSSIEGKLERSVESYRYLQQEHERIMKYQLLEESIRRFREYFNVDTRYTDQKIIDSLIWKFVSGLRSGKLNRQRFAYN